MAQGIGGWERVPGLDWMARFFMSGPPLPPPPHSPSIFQMGNQGRTTSSHLHTHIFKPLNLIKSSYKFRTCSTCSVSPWNIMFFCICILLWGKKQILWTVFSNAISSKSFFLTILAANSHVRISVSWFLLSWSDDPLVGLTVPQQSM